MADITLAECNQRVWVVGGEDYIDDLLANTLPAHVTIEMVRCETMADVHALWVQNCGEPETAGFPWVIHPAIADRIRRGAPGYSVYFAQWSAFLDQDAQAVIREAASWALQNESTPLELVEFLDPAGPPEMADLSRLRAKFIEDRLAEHGIARERLIRVRRDVNEMPGMSQESQRLDIVIRAG